jgi:uncharacterized protein
MSNATRRQTLFASAAAGMLPLAAKAAQAPNQTGFQAFPLAQVRLKPSIFLTAMETNQKYLLSLNPDRLLHNFRVHAGLPAKGEKYGGWESAGIAGHSLGHYHSAVALMYAQTGKAEFKQRALYITLELAACQAAYGDGYAGATTAWRNNKEVDGKVVYEELRKGNIDTSAGLNGGWVPIYTYHKVMAGALDTYSYCQDQASLKVAIGLCDYLGKVFEALNDDQVQKILSIEHGGIAESYAELHAITGDQRWLDLAERTRHRAIVDPLIAGRDELAGKHANTQIPKIIGLARTYERKPNPDYARASLFFWETVVKDHSYAIGGNSEFEHFGEPRKLAARLGQQTCECCNSYNMLKLTRHLYGWSGDARYFDFFERAHLNHILSQQEPETGMFTYFSPLASGFPRVHSTPTDAFWCCVGTGMENYAKLGDSIYWRSGNRLLVNLFYPSSLTWPEKGAQFDMETAFPYDETVTFKVTKARAAVDVSLRIPAWCKAPALQINGKAQAFTPRQGYADLKVKAGDIVTLRLPMTTYSEAMPDDANLVAFFNGPLVLAADLGPANKPWEGYDPIVIGTDAQQILSKTGKAQNFSFSGNSRPEALKLRPYMEQHTNRTAVYFRRFTADDWAKEEPAFVANAKARADILKRTVDVMRFGEQQPEVDHNFSSTPNTGDSGNLTVRTRMLNKGFIQFDMATAPGPLVLQVSYDGAARDKSIDILVDGQPIVTETLAGERTAALNVRQYALPETLTKGKSKITVRFDIKSDQWTSVFEARIFKVKSGEQA